MQDKLVQLEKKYGVDWREYEVGELFESENGNFDIQASHINGKGEYVVSSGETNAGIIGKTDVEAKVFDANTITVDMFGSVFYRSFPYKMVTHARVFSLKFKKGKLSNLTGNYFVSALNYIKKIHSYSDMASFNKIKDYKITLPTINNEIAFDYIDEFVATLEAERLATLEAYLKATGLNNVALSVEERSSLDKLGEAGSVEWREFSLKELFEIYTGRDFIMMTSQKGKIPVISRSSANNGFGIFSDEVQGQKLFNHKETITATLIGKIWSTVHNQDFYLGTRVKGLVIRDKRTSFEMLQFISASLNKVGKSYITYQNKPAEFEGLSIKLPVKNDGELDFEFMTILIKAMQKIVIKGVVEWADKRIEVMEGVVNE